MGNENSGDKVGHPFYGNQWDNTGGVSKAAGNTIELATYVPQRVNKVDLSPASKKDISNAILRAKNIEPVITDMVTGLASETGGTPQGLKFRLKSLQSAESEVGTKMREQKVSTEKAIEGLTDMNRYTISYKDEDYVEKSNTVLKSLEEKGWNVYKDKQRNYWRENTPYKGYNVVLTNGKTVFELQLHTDTSYKLKMFNHPIFELERTEDDPLIRYRYTKMMMGITSLIPNPKGIDSLKGVKK